MSACLTLFIYNSIVGALEKKHGANVDEEIEEEWGEKEGIEKDKENLLQQVHLKTIFSQYFITTISRDLIRGASKKF